MRPHPDFCRDVAELLADFRPEIIFAFTSSLFQFMHGAYENERPFDFVLPDANESVLLLGRKLAPFELVRETARASDASWSQVLALAVKSAGRAPV